ncbi:DUF554 domain-containing protein [Alkalihalobacillus hwajinpoensis]|uniref:DUF554 domain-containing protein n=1 Tax=Guptibacillus hwajinpoensis TaxID=208199 RepID=UPI0018838D81|nr:DUF554 domain-containing protein [Pseudalkalibacillus hwajinpoensis]MBF0704988.1 DUF554 domain-containing protein [Pseudalkalibacillus hwajinpoensis]
MVLLGTVVNGAAIIAGTLIGTVSSRIPEQTKTTIMQGLALVVSVIGLQMAMKSEQFLIVIGSLVLGGILGEYWNLEGKLNDLGKWIERKTGAASEGSVAQAFVTATLVYVVGAMAILGALDSGLRNDHSILFTKSLIDGFTAIMFTATLGYGVLFSAIPVMLYQGVLALFAAQINQFVPQALLDAFIAEVTSAGGIMILAIGLNLLGIVKIRVANFLPALLIAAILVSSLYLMPSMF